MNNYNNMNNQLVKDSLLAVKINEKDAYEVRELLLSGANPNAKLRFNITKSPKYNNSLHQSKNITHIEVYILQLAFRAKNMEVIRLLLKFGARPDIINRLENNNIYKKTYYTDLNENIYTKTFSIVLQLSFLVMYCVICFDYYIGFEILLK